MGSGRIGLVLAAVLGLGVAAWGAETEPASAPSSQPTSQAARAPSAEMTALVQALGAGSFQERQEAQKKLEGLGLEAMVDLKAALAQSRDVEVKTRVGKVIEALEEKVALAPTLVTADFKEAGPKEVVAALEKALGREIEVWPPLEHMGNQRVGVTLTLDKVPFWEAVAKINEQMQIQPMEGQQPGGLRLQIGQARKCGPKWQQNAGAFAFRLLGLTRTHSVSLEGDNDKVNTSFVANMILMADPHLRIAKGPEKVVLTKAVDNKGNSLLVQSNGSYGSSGGFSWQRQVSLAYPEGAGDRITTLAGTAKFLVTLKVAELEIQDLANLKPEEKTFLGMKVTVQSVKEQGDNVTAKIKFERGTMDRQQFSGLFEWNNGAFKILLVDAEGKTRNQNGYGGGGSDSERSYDYTFYLRSYGGEPNAKKFVPVKLRMEGPVKTKEIEVPFEFKDVPLP